MRRVERRSGEIERQHREAGQSVLAVDYEDLFFAGGVAWEALQAFLGLDPHPMEAERVKAELRPLSEVFVQWNDIAEALAGTRWAWMAEPEHQQPTHA